MVLRFYCMNCSLKNRRGFVIIIIIVIMIIIIMIMNSYTNYGYLTSFNWYVSSWYADGGAVAMCIWNQTDPASLRGSGVNPRRVPAENWTHGRIWDSGFCTCDRNQEMRISRDETARALPPARASAQCWIAASAANANKLITPASCNYCIHWGGRSGPSRTGHGGAPAPETRDTRMLMGHRTKWPSVAQSKLYHL